MEFPFLSFILFAFTMLYTPGPNNTMLAISGANFGFRRTLPHMLGVCIGFSTMVALLGAGLGSLLKAFPELLTVLNIASAAFILWFAWSIAMSSTSKEAGTSNNNQAKPLNFMQASMFQWINGKAWLIGLATLGKYLSQESYGRDLAFVCLLLLLVGSTSSSAWVLFGRSVSRFLNTERKMRIFNITMSFLLVLSLLLSYF